MQQVVVAYDLLRDPMVGKHIFIRDEVLFKVQHSLVVRSGVTLDEVTTVLSHEQASGV